MPAETTPGAPHGAPGVAVRLATVSDAATMLALIQRAFAARAPVDPPAAALSDTVDEIEAQLRTGWGVIAEHDGRPVGCLLLSGPHADDLATSDRIIGVHRVSVDPDQRQHGFASLLVHAAADLAIDLGASQLELLSRREFPHTRQWWLDHGFEVHREVELGSMLRTSLPTRVQVPTAEAMQSLGRRLAHVLKAGDLVVLTGELGAGKTTLTQGLGAGLAVSGAIISPTFVLSRVHESAEAARPGLVHVDAYRLSSAAELEDLDLENSLADNITVVEWGAGLAEGLATDRLDIEIRRSASSDDDGREVLLHPVGARWRGVDLGFDTSLSAGDLAGVADE